MKLPRVSPRIVKRGAAILFVGIIACAAYYAFATHGPAYITTAVTRGPIIEQASASGAVKAVQSVDLGFTEGGIVAAVPVHVGDTVRTGDPLVSLDTRALTSQLIAAKAAAAIARAQTGSTVASASTVQIEQDTLVANARRTLLSSDLVAVPNSSSYSVAAPAISGSYDGPEGTYRIIVDCPQSGRCLLQTISLERTDPVTISKTRPTPFGTHGLFISFPDSLQEYQNTIWDIVIPNTRGATYAANLNGYQAAIDARARAVAAAEANLSPSNGSSVAEAQLRAAEAEVHRVETALDQAAITAPFSGIVTRQDAKLGEQVNPGTTLVSVSSTNGLEVELNLSEENVAKVKPGDVVTMTLDAVPGTTLTGTVLRVDPASTVIGGTAYYKTEVALGATDAPLRAGMTVDAFVRTGESQNALIVPASALVYENGDAHVRRLGRGASEERVAVTTGFKSRDGLVEIRSGLSEGDVVILGKK